MHGITSLDGHGKASGDMNKAMERMSIVFKGRLSPEQLNQIKSDIQTTAMSGMAGEMLSAAGEGGDTMMAHMSPETIGMAQEMGILPQGQMNPMTGLPAFQGDNPGNEPDDDNGDTGTGTGSSAGAESSAGTAGEMGGSGVGGAGAGMGMSGPEGSVVDATAGNPTGFAGPGASLSSGLNVSGLTGPEVAIADRAQKEGASNPIGTARAATSMGFVGVNQFSPDVPVDTQVDQAMAARTALDPTMAQLALNERLERGFQQANPGISRAVGVAGTLAGLAVPGFGLVSGIGNTVNAMTGRPTMVDMALGTKAGDPLSGPTQAIADFARDSGLMSGIQSLAEAAGPVPTETAADVEMAEHGLGNENFVPDESETPTTEEEPAPDQFSEKAKLLGAGYSESDAQTILDNFGTLDTFQQRFEGRFGVPPTPAQLMEADKQQFINIRRGRPVGMGSGIGSLRT